MTGLAEKVELLHDRLDEARIPHAFGGALALAYCVSEPRATADIDLNVFVAPARAGDVFAAMPDGVSVSERDAEVALDRGQVRLRWGETPVDLFFAYHRFHRDASGRIRVVAFGADRIPVLDCGDLAVFKAIFGRPQDWVDIEGMIGSGAIEIEEPLARLSALVGKDDPIYRRLASMAKAEADEAGAYRRVFGSPGDPGRGPRVDHGPEPAE